ncbi:sulfatase family protein [Parapedobacter sp. DT-150]|uniref:sulfatase family protein n=1 Tax=Parapedobacter sp. DT-150 TaxID=3396162 RepID=UPI003F1D9B41
MSNKIRQALLPLLLIALSGFADRHPVDQQPERPNVILIFMDDMGYGDLTSYGGGPWQMPHTARLAAEGMRFTHFYAAQAICSASRAALLTGCYPNRVGISGALFPDRGTGLHPQEETIADVLKGAGYSTAMVGKWHLGSEEVFLPHHQGFDRYYGLPYSNDMWPVDYAGKPAGKDHRKAQFPRLPLLESRVGENEVDTVQIISTLEDQGMLTTLYTEKAVSYIKSQKEAPFFLYLAHSMPHVPIAVSEKFRGKSGNGLFADLMMEIDWSVGEILRALEETGQAENTLVILTSDNGPWLSYGNHAGSSSGLREGKASSWEGGVRIPALMRWPKRIPAGTVCNQLSSTIDVLPTVAALCGAALPQRKIDGVDIRPLLQGDADAAPRKELALYFGGNNLEGLVSGYWKLVLPHRYTTYKKTLPGFDGWPGETRQDSTGLALYDLRHDPGETLDVKAHYPEVVQQLEASIEKYKEDLGDDLTDRKGANRRSAMHIQAKK